MSDIGNSLSDLVYAHPGLKMEMYGQKLEELGYEDVKVRSLIKIMASGGYLYCKVDGTVYPTAKLEWLIEKRS